MIKVLLVLHVFVTMALIGVVLIQRSEGGGLGVGGGGGGGMGSFMSGRGTANLLTRTTAILAVIFMGLSMTLAVLNRGTSGSTTRSILDAPAPASTTAPASAPSAAPPATPPPAPSGPSAPTN